MSSFEEFVVRDLGLIVLCLNMVCFYLGYRFRCMIAGMNEEAAQGWKNVYEELAEVHRKAVSDHTRNLEWLYNHIKDLKADHMKTLEWTHKQVQEYVIKGRRRVILPEPSNN